MFAEVVVHTPMARRLTDTPSPEPAAPAAPEQPFPAAPPAGTESGETASGALEGLTFHYAVPAHLHGTLQPGHLVWVPFGRQQLQGVVLALAVQPPPGVDPRPIDGLVMPEPVCTPAQLELATWLSHRYLAPILDCLLLMLPPGLAQAAEPVLALTPLAQQALAEAVDAAAGTAEPHQMAFGSADFAEALPPDVHFPQFPDLKPAQHALLDLLHRRGQVRESDLRRRAPALARRSVWQPLLDQGLIARQRQVVQPPPRPKAVRQVTLLADQATIDRVLPTLGRPSKQAGLLAWLAAHPGPSPLVAEACAAVGCTMAPLRSLARRSWITIDRQQRVALALPPGEIPARLIQLRRGEKYQRALAALAAAPGPVGLGWLAAEANVDLPTLRTLAAAGLVSLDTAEVWRDPLAGQEFVADQPPALTPDQAAVWQTITEAMDPGLPSAAFLLHGVTGSGKTEIYLRAIAATLAAGRQALVLVPEIALTPQTVRRFAARFGGRVTVYHSGLSAGERYDVWRLARGGDPRASVVVGTRSALFLPLPRLGLVVLDEEHDPSYKEAQRSPRYHARDAALHLARLAPATVVLGSATPALETTYAAELGQIRRLHLPRRIMGHARAIAEQQERLHLPHTVYHPLPVAPDALYTDLPRVQVVDLRQELRAGNRSVLSRSLQEALTGTLASGQQAILFLNRRGTATFVICRDCGHVLTCAHCDVPLTYHLPVGGGEAHPTLVCHHCGRRQPSPERCPECASRRIRYLGTGTEKIAELVQSLWPAARVLRWDRDVTGRKGSHDAILSRFVQREADVMVGTQMIAKGLDLPMVTLVGVISADVGLYLPDFRAAERSFQLLTQVAGRAGRSLLGGRVIVQSYRPEHYVIQAARRHDYLDFYRQELGFRRELGYPPFRRLAKLVFLHAKEDHARAAAEALGRGLRVLIHQHDLGDVDLIGPAPCFFGRESGKYRWQIVVRAPDPAALLRLATIPPGWRIDVDPATVL